MSNFVIAYKQNQEIIMCSIRLWKKAKNERIISISTTVYWFDCPKVVIVN